MKAFGEFKIQTTTNYGALTYKTGTYIKGKIK